MWRKLSRPERVEVRRRPKVVLPVVALVLAGAAVLAAGRAGLAAPTVTHEAAGSSTGCGWSLVSTPNQGTYNTLNAVAVLPGGEAWSVGSRGPGAPGQLTLIEQWDGQAWTIVPAPNPSSGSNDLQDVAAISMNDAWAVGRHGSSISSSSQTLILHWDGATWSQVPSPSPGGLDNRLYGVAAVSANDVWAVGHSWIAGVRYRTLVLHWDGTTWSQIPSPSIGTFDNELTAVAAVSSNDVWAVGQYVLSSGLLQTLILHWNGINWSIVPGHNVEGANTFLNGISTSSAGDAWAVGYWCTGNCLGANVRRTFTMRWDGSAWSMVPHPDVGTEETILHDVVALSGDNAWAVGHYDSGSLRGTLATHWDGSTWSVAPSANPQSCCPQLHDIAALSSSDLWAVGDYHFAGNPVFRTLAERYSAACGTATVTPIPLTPTPSNTPTRTPTDEPAATATATNTPTNTPVSTPTHTATPCVLSFSDVHPADYFYQAVTYLACRGAVSGYSDGTFRPYNNATRGQLTKIIVLAEGWPLQTPATPTFRDVPLDHPFFTYVETAYAHTIISGYSCGAGCLEFRSANNITRAQLTKVIVLAKGWQISPPAQPTFRDVPASDPFYGYVESAYEHHIISGYSCGSGCLEFRPGNDATRGQISRIVHAAGR